MAPFGLPASLRNDYLACTVMERGETLVKILVSHWKSNVRLGWVVVSSLPGILGRFAL